MTYQTEMFSETKWIEIYYVDKYIAYELYRKKYKKFVQDVSLHKN